MSLVIRDVRRFDPYENRALSMVDDLAGEYCADLGKTDMGEMDETERLLLWRHVVEGFGDSI